MDVNACIGNLTGRMYLFFAVHELQQRLTTRKYVFPQFLAPFVYVQVDTCTSHRCHTAERSNDAESLSSIDSPRRA
jgi:hypothetical protein